MSDTTNSTLFSQNV